MGRTLVVGPCETPISGDLFIAGGGWTGGSSQKQINVPPQFGRLALPFGPYIAACLAAGEIFKAARMPAETYSSPAAVFYSAWSHKTSEMPLEWQSSEPTETVPVEVSSLLDAAIVGVGAVGCAAIHTLWACPGLNGTVALLDNDAKGLEHTNLNRYTLFGVSSVGSPKASSAAKVADDSSIAWVPKDIGVESSGVSTPRVISAVDRNSARSAIQGNYPARIISASTHDLRAEVLRCGPPWRRGLSPVL